MLQKRRIFNEDGNILIMSVVIVALLIATGMGYMKWATDERWDTAYEQATVQAYFLAQTGLVERGLVYLRSRRPADLPTASVFLNDGIIRDAGTFKNVKVMRVTTMGSGNIFQRSDTYDVFATGVAKFRDHALGNRTYGQDIEVQRTAKMRARLRSFSNYMYLTHFEATSFNEIIWFWTYDSLWGRVHSNDYIGLKYSPHFYGPVSTCKSEFLYFQPENIHFEYPPQFEVTPVLFPRTAETLRANANWVDGLGRYMTRVWLRGNAGITTYQYELGENPPPVYGWEEGDVSNIQHQPMPAWGGLFVDGPAEVYGEVHGNITIGTSGDMYLVDDVYYSDVDPTNPGGLNNWANINAHQYLCGLVSEGNIIIRDNDLNGKENGAALGGQRFERHSITITAGLVALGESFTFEHQNDDWEAYQGPTPDERGIIHLRGAVTQLRRGYVHRSNHGTGIRDGTGYGKDYIYDFRFDMRPPPFYLEARDDEGYALFDIISFTELEPTR